MCAVSIAQRGRRDAHIFIEHGRGRGIARGDVRARARCYLAAQSRLGKFQHCHQLEPGGGADQYRDLRRVEYNLHIIPTLHDKRRSQRCSSTLVRLLIVSLHLKASSHQSASPVPALSTILPTHRLLSSATRRTFFFAVRAPPATPP